MSQRNASLRGLLLVGVGALALLATTVIAGFIGLTSVMHRATSDLENAGTGIRLAEELQVLLLSYSRLQVLAGLSDSAVPESTEQALEANLRERFAAAAAHATSDDERALVTQALASFEAYLSLSDEARRRGASQTRITQVAFPEMRDALRSLEQLVEINMDQRGQASARVARGDRNSNILGASMGLLILLGLAAIAYLARVSLQPVFGIRSAMRRFAAGDRSARAALLGPREISGIAEQFNDMAAQLERRREEQVAFLSGVAHDLRNPLSALRMATGAISANRPLPPEEKMRARLALVGRQVDQLDRMVGDLLDMTRIEAGRFEVRLAETDLRDQARAVVELFAGGSDKHRLVLEQPEDPVLARCDSHRIEQVLTNLVSNAIKYSPEGGEVKVSVHRDGAEAVLWVRDSGIGIAPEDQSRVFEPFRRTRAAVEGFAGLGLGLSTSRRIVEAHGGRIEVRSKPGAGSLFLVNLPVSGPQTGLVPPREQRRD